MDFDKSMVYTALNADIVKPGTRVLVANNLDALKQKVNAYDKEDDRHEATEPATVIDIQDECMCNRFKVKFDGIDDRDYEYSLVYVIPQTERPFNNLAELITFWDMHLQKEKRPPFTLPFIWVMDINKNTHMLITGFRKSDESVKIGGHWYNLQYMFDNFTFEDGRPFGAVIK